MPDAPKPSDLAALKQGNQGPAEDENPPAEEPETPEEPDTDDDPEDGDPEALGDAGKRALDSMKSKYRAERQSRRELEQRLEAFEAEKRSADLSEQEKAIADAKAEATAEALSKANERVARSEFKAAAAGKVSDLALALQLVDLNGIDVDDDGNVDEDQITESLDDLVKQYPILAAQSSGGGFDSARGKTRPDNPSLGERIAKAEADGDWSTARALKAQRLGG